MKAYKLTDENHCTRGDTKRGNTKWGENISHTATGKEQYLCSAGWIHFYTDPHLAVFMNPIHAKFKNPAMWECETDGEHLHEPLKSGCKTLTTIRQIPMSEVTTIQRGVFAILCAMEVYKEPNWTAWADKWLSGEDRTNVAAAAAYYATTTAAGAASAAAAYYATTAASADAASAASAAADAASAAAADAASAASAASYAASAASYAAESASYAAESAEAAAEAAAAAASYATTKDIDFIGIARKALTYK